MRTLLHLLLSVRTPNHANLVGVKLTLWSLAHDGPRFVASNGLEFGVCKK